MYHEEPIMAKGTSAPKVQDTLVTTVHETLCRAVNNASHLNHIRNNLDGILSGDTPCEVAACSEPPPENIGLANLVHSLLELTNVTASSLQELDNVIRGRIG